MQCGIAEVLGRATCAGHAHVGRDTRLVARPLLVTHEDRGGRKASRETADVLVEYRHSVNEVRSPLQVATQTDRVDEHVAILRCESGPQPFKHVCGENAEQLLGIEVRIEVVVCAAGSVHALIVAGARPTARHLAG